MRALYCGGYDDCELLHGTIRTTDFTLMTGDRFCRQNIADTVGGVDLMLLSSKSRWNAGRPQVWVGDDWMALYLLDGWLRAMAPGARMLCDFTWFNSLSDTLDPSEASRIAPIGSDDCRVFGSMRHDDAFYEVGAAGTPEAYDPNRAGIHVANHPWEYAGDFVRGSRLVGAFTYHFCTGMGFVYQHPRVLA